MIIELDLDPATVAQIDTLARRLGIVEVGDDRGAKRRSEVVRRLLAMWEARAPDDGKRFCSACRRRHGPEVVHPCE